MRRPSKSTSPKLSADSQRLIAFAHAIVQAASRLEERLWERNLDALLYKMLKNNHQEALDTALDHLFKADLNTYDALVEAVEAASESCSIEQDGVRYDALLIGAPALAWTRFSIPAGPIAPDLLQTISAHLSAHILAGDTRLAVAPMFFSIDQLPRTHAETYALTQNMAQAALKGTPLRAPANVLETVPFLADIRFLLGVVVVPAGAPMFRWQMPQSQPNIKLDREQALAQWRAQATSNVARLLPGCGVELLLPEAYYIACREADRQIRPTSIRAAVHFLTHTLSVEPQDLHVVIGGFGDESTNDQLDEYRVGFALGKKPDIVYGIIWPLYGQEDENNPDMPPEIKSPIEEILGLLHEAGIKHIKRHNERFPMEFCDDCGAPMFADADGELVHPEMPEDAPQDAGHFH